jgi:hypothetical protein
MPASLREKRQLSVSSQQAGRCAQPVSSQSVAHGKRWTRLLTGAGLAVAAALAAAGCASGSSTSAGTQSGSAAPAVTLAEASRAYGHYLAATTAAGAVQDKTAMLSHVTDVAEVVQSTNYLTMTYYHVHPPAADVRYGKPVFYLPESAGYPQWFVAEVGTTYTGSKPPAGTTVAGTAGGVQWEFSDGHILLLFKKAGATDGWQLSSESALAPGESVPALAKDASGHVPVVPLSDTALLVRPDVTGPLQAAVVDDGPASAATKVVANGPLTTGIYGNERAGLLGLSAPRGDVYQWQLEGSNYTKFALRTADGGALVFYAMYLNTTVDVPAVLNKGVAKPGPPITVPGYLRPLLPAGKTAPRESLEAQQLLSFATVDPPSGNGNGRIQVIAIGGGNSYATAS